MTERARIHSEAAAWAAKIDRDQWDRLQEAELQAWLARDSRHRGALLQMQAAWMTADPANMDADTGAGCIEHDHRIARRQVLAGGGAAVAASLIGGFVWANWPTNLSTKIGEIRRIPLADGSVATINTASRIEVMLADQHRDVRLDAGEAWFQVAKDRRRPFTVSAGQARVRAVGTAFSVRRFDNGVQVLVTEGVVEAWIDGAKGGRARLVAGQSAFIAENVAFTDTVEQPMAIERALAWRSGKIDLVSEPLSAAIADFNRYNERQLVLGDRRLAAEQLDGVFWIDDPAGFATAVHSAFNTPIDLSDPARITIGHATL